MSVLALDLGTSTGWAWCDGESLDCMISGTWRLLASKSALRETRFINFVESLTVLHQYRSIAAIYYEDVRRHLGTDAAHVFGGFKSHAAVWCLQNGGIPFESVDVSTIKKFWTSNGRASKDMMIDECINRGFKPQTDDEADAIALLHYVMKKGAS